MQSRWFMLVIGLLVGLIIGYVMGDRQTMVADSATSPPAPSSTDQQAMPADHPPIEGGRAQRATLLSRARELETQLTDRPDDPVLLAGIGNLYFDAGEFAEACDYYERSLEHDPDDADVLTDLAIANHSLQRFERALELLDRALAVNSQQWQAVYNKVIVFMDMGRRDEASRQLELLETMRTTNPEVPELTALRQIVTGR